MEILAVGYDIASFDQYEIGEEGSRKVCNFVDVGKSMLLKVVECIFHSSQ
jgi:hypothetical protein